MTICSFLCCKNDSRRSDTGISFHGFPADPVICSRWTEIIRKSRGEDEWKPSKSSVICSAHFREKDMYRTKLGFQKVAKGAEPKLALNINLFMADPKENDNNDPEAIPSTSSVELAQFSDDDSILDSPRKYKMRKKLRKAVELRDRYRRQVKNLLRKNHRLEARCTSLKLANTMLKMELLKKI